MTYEILKDFDYSPNGIKINSLKKGGTDGILEKDVKDMATAGYIRIISDEPESKVVSAKAAEHKPEGNAEAQAEADDGGQDDADSGKSDPSLNPVNKFFSRKNKKKNK